METDLGGQLSRTLRLAVTLLCITCLAVAPASAGDGSSNGRADRRRCQRDGYEVVRRAFEPARDEGHEQGHPQGRARRVQGQCGRRGRQAHRALLVRLALERRLGVGGSVAGRVSPLGLRREGCLSGRDAVASPIGERRQQHRFGERCRAHGRRYRPDRARARRLRRDDRDHGQRSRLHAARVRRLLRARVQGARRVRPRRRRLQRDPWPRLPSGSAA